MLSLLGCKSKTNPAGADAGTIDAAEVDARVGVDAPSIPLPPLAGPVLDGTHPADPTLTALMATWTASPTVEDAPAIEEAARENLQELRAMGEAGADRIASACDSVAASDSSGTALCARLLGVVDSASSIEYLLERAATEVPPPEAGVHSPFVQPELAARAFAVGALERRARDGSARAVTALTDLASSSDVTLHGPASDALLRALPRYQAKALLREALPADEQWRLYQVR